MFLIIIKRLKINGLVIVMDLKCPKTLTLNSINQINHVTQQSKLFVVVLHFPNLKSTQCECQFSAHTLLLTVDGASSPAV